MEMSVSYISRDVWTQVIAGHVITDVAVRDSNLLYLCMREKVSHDKASRMWDHDIPTTFCLIRLHKPADPLGSLIFEGYNKPRIGVSLLPVAQGLIVARNNDGQVRPVGGGRDFPDEFIDPGKVPMTWRIKTLDGYAYSVGGQRSIYKRVEVGRWEKVHDWPLADSVSSVGFQDMDAFSPDDMYAVGGHGDVWHFDGQKWRQMGFPTNQQLATVTCAGDGNVYISTEGGSLWTGRKSTWKPIHEGTSTINWNDALWFQDQLWLASDYQFRVWNGKSMEHVTHNGEEVPIYGHMDVRDGLLAIASPETVMTFDGQQWRTIVAPYL